MNTFSRIPNASISQENSPLQRVQGPNKIQVDNRPMAVKQRKLQAGIQQSAQLKAIASVIQRARGKKGGTFIGVAGSHHIHEIGGNAHYKYHNSAPVAFNHGGRINRDGVLRAIDECNAQQLQTGDNAGYQACLDYLNGLLANTPATVTVTPSPGSGPSRKPDPKPKPGGKKADKYASFSGGGELDAFAF